MSGLFAWEPGWRTAVDQVVVPTLQTFEGRAVATGAVGMWLHGLLYRPPTLDGVLLATRHPHDVHPLTATLTATTAAVGGQLAADRSRPESVTGMLTLPPLAVPVAVVCRPLPEDAFDPLFGVWRVTTATWVLAVEALARASMAPAGAAADAAATDLMVLAELLGWSQSDWTDALQLAGTAALRPYVVARRGGYASPELRHIADLVERDRC